MIQVSYVLPVGAGPRPWSDKHGLSVRVDDEAACARCECDRARVGIGEHYAAARSRSSARACVVELARQIRCPQPDSERDDGSDGRDRAEHGRDAPPPWLERHDVLQRLGADVREDALAQSRARLRPRCRDGQGLGRRPERRELLLALLAVREVRLVGTPLVLIERVERVAGGQLVNSGFHDPSCAESSRISRRRASPANILLLMVPSGTPSRSASSDCEKPP